MEISPKNNFCRRVFKTELGGHSKDSASRFSTACPESTIWFKDMYVSPNETFEHSREELCARRGLAISIEDRLHYGGIMERPSGAAGSEIYDSELQIKIEDVKAAEASFEQVAPAVVQLDSQARACIKDSLGHSEEARKFAETSDDDDDKVEAKAQTSDKRLDDEEPELLQKEFEHALRLNETKGTNFSKLSLKSPLNFLPSLCYC